MKNISVIFLMILFVLQAPISILADITAPPRFVFYLFYETKTPITFIGGIHVECLNESCTNASSSDVQEYGPDTQLCDSNWQCTSFARTNSAEYHKLIIKFSDKVRESQVFRSLYTTVTFFKIRVTDSSLIIEEIGSREAEEIRATHKPVRFENNQT